jgi:hypothetical protein
VAGIPAVKCYFRVSYASSAATRASSVVRAAEAERAERMASR